MMMMGVNILLLWTGRQEQSMKNRDLSILWNMIRKVKKSLECQNLFGEAGLTEGALRHLILPNMVSITILCVQKAERGIITALQWDVPKMFWDLMKQIPAIRF